MTFAAAKDRFSELRVVVSTLWRSGLFRFRLSELGPIAMARWRCGNSFAFLSEVGAIRFGARWALQDDDGCLTFQQLHQQSLDLAGKLAQQFQVGPGSQVALVSGNHRSFVLGLLACTRLGADVLPLAADLPPAVMSVILARQKIDLVLCQSALCDRLAFLPPEVRRATCTPEEHGQVWRPSRVRRGGELIVLTSGTSGISKGIKRRPTLAQVLPLVSGLLQAIGITMHRPVVMAIPLYHGYGIATLAMALALGSPLQLGQRYEVGPLLQRLSESERPFLVTVPTLLARWIKGDRAQLSIRPAAVITGSAPLESSLCSALLKLLGPVLFNLYGSTEAGLVALAGPDVLARFPGSVGRPLPGNQVKLLDPLGLPVEIGHLGSIAVRGPFVLAADQEGWRQTGDLGRLDADGNLYVCGRVDAMIVSGGENVYPQEIEERLLGHSEVAGVTVLAVDDPDFGQRLVAVVVLTADSELGGPQILEWLKQHLERHKTPRSLFVVSSIPKNALGKVDRLALLRLLDAPEP